MVKQIIKDVFFLSQKAEPATKDDIQTAQDDGAQEQDHR